MCDCIEQFFKNETMREHNTKLVVSIPLKAGYVSRAIIRTEKIDTKKRVGPVSIVPSFCPFCGEKYVDKNNSDDLLDRITMEA